MPGIRELQNAKIPKDSMPPGPGAVGVLVLTTTKTPIIVGGAKVKLPAAPEGAPPANEPPGPPAQPTLIECWGVSDLTGDHWSPATFSGEAMIEYVPAYIADAVRLSLVRFGQMHDQAIAREISLREGLNQGIEVMTREILRAGLTVARRQ